MALIWLSQTTTGGPTLLCVPGTMCSPRIFMGLTGKDGPGCPVAAAPWLEWPGPHDMTMLGATVAELAAGLSPVVLVGHSTGGVIALPAALQAPPGTVAGIVLCDTGANMHGHGDVDAIIERVRQDWGRPLREQVVRRSAHLEPDEAALVVHGRHDAARPVSHAEQLAAALPGAELVVLDCGHSPPAELPGQFNAVERLSGMELCLMDHRSGPDAFDEFRIGLDHLEFLVLDRADLDAWVTRLDELGIDHCGVKEPSYTSNAMVTFRDPDNIQLEFFWRPPPHGHS